MEKAIKASESEEPASKEPEGKEEEKKQESKSEPPKEEEKKQKKPEPESEAEPKQPTKDDKPAPKKEAPSEAGQPAPRDYIFASPIAKRLALDKGIPLSKLKGTGPNGRIIKADIENYKPSAQAASGETASGPPPSSAKMPPGSPPAKDMSVPTNYTDIPASTMRKVIASRLTESKQNIPHYYLTAEIKMDRVMKLREIFNKAASATDRGSKDGVKSGMKLSVNDFVVKACASALQDVPEANSAWMGDFIRQ